MEEVTEVFACKCFETGIDCSQITLGHCAEKIGLDEKSAMRMSSAFGGGMWNGETCGCVVGALMALGYKYGTDAPGQNEAKQFLLAKKVKKAKGTMLPAIIPAPRGRCQRGGRGAAPARNRAPRAEIPLPRAGRWI